MWVSAEFLAKRGEAGEGQLPIWAPSSGDTIGYHTYSNAKALAAGLKCRDPKATTKDTIEWFGGLPATRTETSRDNTLHAGLKPEEEAKMLAEWKAGDDKDK